MTPIERNIATKLIGALLEAGYRLGVNIDPILDWLTSVEDIAEHNRPAVPTTDADAPMGA